MTGPPSSESQPVVAGAGSYEAELPPPQHADDQAYQEDVVAQSMPTKTGDDDTYLYDCECPVSAGTAHYNEFDFDASQSDDEAVITNLSHKTGTELTNTTYATESRGEGDFLPKPEISAVPDPGESFSFTKARRLSMNFTPTRQASAFHMLPTPRLTGERVTRGDSPDALNADGVPP